MIRGIWFSFFVNVVKLAESQKLCLVAPRGELSVKSCLNRAWLENNKLVYLPELKLSICIVDPNFKLLFLYLDLHLNFHSMIHQWWICDSWPVSCTWETRRIIVLHYDLFLNFSGLLFYMQFNNSRRKRINSRSQVSLYWKSLSRASLMWYNFCWYSIIELLLMIVLIEGMQTFGCDPVHIDRMTPYFLTSWAFLDVLCSF